MLVEMGMAVRQCLWKIQEVGSGAMAWEVLRDTIIPHSVVL